MPLIGGNPAAVEAAAVELGRAGRDLDDAGESIRSRGRTVSADWTGTASDAATDSIDAIGRAALVAADAMTAAEPIYRTYADELRTAQREYAAGEAMAAAGRAQQLGAAAQALRADRPSIDPGRDAAVAAAQQASTRAAQVVAKGEAMMAAAVQRERVADEVAAAAIRALTAQVRAITVPAPAQQAYEPTAAAAGSAGAPAEDERWYRGIQRAAGGAVDLAGDVTDGAGEAWDAYREWDQNVTGALGEVAWDAGPGAVSGLLHLSPFESDQQVADGIDDAKGWLQREWGADTDSGEYQAVYGGGSLAGMVFGAGKIKTGAEAINGAAKAVTRGGDDAAGTAARAGDDAAGAATRTPEQEAALQRGRDRLGGATPRNSRYAGQQYPLPPALAARYPQGVRFTDEGFPDFSPHATHHVEIDPLGPTRRHDNARANAAAGLDRTPGDYTWHHKEDGTMQLVPTDLHREVQHSGGVRAGKARGIYR